MTYFRPISVRDIEPSLAADLSRFLELRAAQSAANPVVFCSTRAFRTNIQQFSAYFGLPASRFIFSTKTLPVKPLVDVALAMGMRFLFYGQPSFQQMCSGWRQQRIRERAIVGDACFEPGVADAILASGVRQFMITRLDSFEVVYEAYKRAKASAVRQSLLARLRRLALVPTDGPLIFFPLTGNPHPENHWFNKNVIPPHDLVSVAGAIADMEPSGDVTLGGVYVYSGNPFTKLTRSMLQDYLLTPTNMRILEYRDCIWGGLGKVREHDVELRELIHSIPAARHCIDFGTALTYNSSALIAKVRHLAHPLSVDADRITIEWGLTTGAHDIKYIYARSSVNVMLADVSGRILDVSPDTEGSEVMVDGASMASDDNNVGVLHLPKGVREEDIGYLIFLDTQYMQAFEFKQQLLGGNRSLEVVVY